MSGLALAFVVGLIALRTQGVSFLIVTLMFAQAAYLTTLYFNNITRGDEGFVLTVASRQLSLGGDGICPERPGYQVQLRAAAVRVRATC